VCAVRMRLLSTTAFIAARGALAFFFRWDVVSLPLRGAGGGCLWVEWLVVVVVVVVVVIFAVPAMIVYKRSVIHCRPRSQFLQSPTFLSRT
jgi:hypothetical protein